MQSENHNSNAPAPPVIVDQDFERFIPLAVVHHHQQQQQQSHFVPVTVSIKTKVGTHLNSPYADKNHHHRLSDNGAGSSDNNNKPTAKTLSTFFSAAQFVGKSASDHPRGDLEEVHEFIDRKVTLPITFQRISLGGDDRDHHHTFAAPLSGGSCSRGKNSLEELSEDSGYCGEHSLGQLVQLNAAIESSRAADVQINNKLTRDHRSASSSSSSASSSSSSFSIATATTNLNAAKAATTEKVYDEEGEEQQLRGLKITAENRERYSQNHNQDYEEEEDEEVDMVRQRGSVAVSTVGALPRIDDCDENEEEQDEGEEGTSPVESSKNTRENKRFLRRKNRSAHFPFGRKRKLGACQRIASRSLPNIFLNQVTPTAADYDQSDSPAVCCTGGFSGRSSSSAAGEKDTVKCAGVDSEDLLSDEFLKVNSFPEGLNYLLSGSFSDNEDGAGSDGAEGDSDPGDCYDFEECQEFFSNDYYFMQHGEADGSCGFVGGGGATDYFYPEIGGGSTISSKNLDLNQLLGASSASSSSSINRSFSCRTAEPAVLQHQTKAGILSASYSNLTALDYSAPSPSAHGRLFTKMDKRSGSGSGARPTIANPEITLLDELSFNFDKNLSIINDRCGNFEPLIEDEDGEVEEQEQEEYGAIIGILNIKKPPKPPPRRYRKGDSMENLRVPGESCSVTGGSSKASSRESLTFDRDPTNLVTCYAASLERCNFDTLDQPQPMNYHRSSASSLQNQQEHLMTTTQNSHQSQSVNKELVVSTPNLSIRRDLQVFNDDALSLENKSRTMGILNVSSRGSLYKEVSFHPIVSEISWRHEKQSEDDSLSEDSLDDGQHDAGNDSDVESDGGKYRDDAEEDYFGLKKIENFKDLDLTSPSGKSSSTPALLTTGEPVPSRQIITIKKTIILTPVSGVMDLIRVKENFVFKWNFVGGVILRAILVDLSGTIK